jgi:hypothetical protein
LDPDAGAMSAARDLSMLVARTHRVTWKGVEMARRLLLVVLLGLLSSAVPAREAEAKGAGITPAPDGVTVAGLPYRYVALAAGHPDKLTVIERIDREGGRVSRWWHLPGIYYVPAVAYDGQGGGLSADGTTLVLNRFTRAYPPRTTRLAILDTGLSLRPRHPRRGEPHPPEAIAQVSLNGHFGFDAISPDGSTIYLIHYLARSSGPAYITDYEIRAFDVESGRLLPKPIVDPEEPDERMEGLPITRASSPNGRWAYTLYDGNGKEPFVHALDTVRGSAVCIDLPQLEDRRNLFMFRLRMEAGGRRLAVLNRPPDLGGSRQLLSVDTRTFAVRAPAPAAVASGGGVSPWLPIGLGAGILAVVLVGALATRERAADRRRLEQG